MQDLPPISESKTDIYNVSRLNREVRAVLEGSFQTIWIQGEISNLVQPASGHLYFSLKDDFSQVRCAMFRNKNRSLKFKPENGGQILAYANISLYEDRGDYQLIIEQMDPAGDGLLQRAFEELKKKLFAEGLFNEDHKKRLPAAPKCIGIITSPTGAAIKDILSILEKRFPIAEVIIYPTAVQGEDAVSQIIHMLDIAEIRNECEVFILTRGGGSSEDLWVFNNEQLARRIFDFTLPVVTGIGHEIDFTIADFVADQRAATPSSAAALVSPDQMQLNQQLFDYEKVFLRLINNQVNSLKQSVLTLSKQLTDPARQLQMLSQRLDGFYLRLIHTLQGRINSHKHTLNDLLVSLNSKNPSQSLSIYQERCRNLYQRLNRAITSSINYQKDKLFQLTSTCESISPYATLNRGYAIVSKLHSNEIIHKSAQLKTDEKIHIRFSKGTASGTVNKVEKGD